MESNRSSIMFDPNDIVNESFQMRFSSVKLKEQPIQLIDYQENRLVINPEAMSLLRTIEEEIIIISGIGKAKTGKSYLLNLLLDTDKGFQVSSSVNPCTKGIWMWGNYREKPTGTAKMIFIDSEGLSSLVPTKSYDAKIFALIILISSTIIYNSYSNIDEAGISDLGLATEIANSISINAKIDKEAFITESSPKFIWVLRDFALTKVDQESKKEISAKEYLELCLRNKIIKNSSTNNKIRDLIIKYFPDRDCCTLVRPIDDESDLKKLNQISKQKLKQEFRDELDTLKVKIFKDSLSKKIRGKKFNGPSLALLIEQWIDAINKGSVPNISTILDNLINNDIQEFYEKALKTYFNKIETLNAVMEQEEIVRKLYDFKLEAMLRYNQIFNFDQDSFNNTQYLAKYNEKKRILESEILKCESKIIEKNSKDSSLDCSKLLEESYKSLNEKISKSYYNVKTCDEYLKDHERFLNNYTNNAKGPEKVKELVEFLSKKKPEFIEQYVTDIQNENNKKLDEMIKFLTNHEKNKIEASEKNKKLNDTSEKLNNRISDLNSDLEKKKRENIELAEKIEKIELEIKSRRKGSKN